MQNFIIALLICSVTMSALAMLYMALTPFLAKRYSEKGRYYAWLIIVIGLIIPFRLSWASAIFTVDVGVADASNDFVNTATQTWGSNIVTIPTFVADANTTPIVTTFNITLWHGIAAVWLIGMAAFIAYQAIRHYRFVKTARRWSEVVTDERTLSVFHELKMEMGIKRQIGLYISPCAGSPMMIGLIEPQILLPTEGLAESELRFILKHELVHYKRNDLLYKSLVLIATAIHWFNPVVYLMARAVNTLCETSCDAEVVRNTSEDTRLQYSEAIIGVVKYRSKTKLATALSTNFYGGKKDMKNRISSILDTSKKKAGIIILCGALLFTMGTGFVVANTNSPTVPEAETSESTPNMRNIHGWQPHDTIKDLDLPFEVMSPAELEKKLEEFRESSEALFAFSGMDWDELAEAITEFDELIAQAKEGNLNLSGLFNTELLAEFDLFTIAGEHSLQSANIFAEYEEWGLTIEGLYPNPDGGFTASPRMNVFLHGQLVRGFDDFYNGVRTTISSVEQGGSVWVRVIRDVDGNIERLDTE